MSQPRILAFAGSARTDSLNKKLVAAAALAARQAGADVTLVDLRDYPLPVYDGDGEVAEGLPGPAIRLKELFKANDGLLIASPEYNSSLPPLLKNVIDWVSRPHADEKPMECFAGKVAALLAASPGGLGGLRGLVHVRSILGNIRVHVIPEQRAISGAHDVFDEHGGIRDEKMQESIAAVARALVETTRRLRS